MCRKGSIVFAPRKLCCSYLFDSWQACRLKRMENKLIVPPSTAAAPGGNKGLAGETESQESDDSELVHDSHHLLLRVWYIVLASSVPSFVETRNRT